MAKAAPRAIGFTVQRTISYLTAPPETTIEFDRIVTNIGGYWNPFSNIFVAPVEGMYMFHLYVFRGRTMGNLNAFIVRDGVKLALAHVNAEYLFGDSSVSLIVHLYRGNNVFSRLSGGVLHSFTRHGGPAIVHFSGFLITTM